MLLLEDILAGKEQSKILLIKDTIELSAYSLTTCYLKILSKRFNQVHVMCLDISPKIFQNVLTKETLQNCTFHDFTSDPLGWLPKGKPSIKSTDLIRHLQNDLRLKNSCFTGQQQVALLICSLTNLIIHRSPSFTCRFIENLVDTQSPAFPGVIVDHVVCVVHDDLHTEPVLSQLAYIADSLITVEKSAPSPDTFMNCQILHHKMTGKILQTKEQFRLSSDYDLKDVTEIKSVAITALQEDQPDPTANLTFNLSLSDKEKADRSRQVLPHVKIQNTPNGDETNRHIEEGGGGGGGQIFYELDDADDYDEEDPDDDLDI